MAKEYGISLGRILKEEGRRRDFNQTKFSRWPFPTMDIDLCSMGSSGDRVLGLVRGGLEGRGGFRWNLINWYCARFPKFISAKYLRVFRRCTESLVNRYFKTIWEKRALCS